MTSQQMRSNRELKLTKEANGELDPEGITRELLVYRLLQRYAVFSKRGDVKTIDNPPDPTLGWKSRFFFAQLSSERDILGVPGWWVEPLPDPISMLDTGLGRLSAVSPDNSVASTDLDRFHRQNSVDGEQNSVASTDFDRFGRQDSVDHSVNVH
ncbi:hypothetical protein ACLOJK_024045 [Asimina triloba]